MIYRIIILISLWSSMSFCQSKTANAIEAKAFEALVAQPKTVVIDVRTPDEYNAGHIPNAVNIDFFDSDFEKKISQYPKDATIALYCKVGGRSTKAQQLFIKNGYANTYNLKGGYESYLIKK